MVTFEKFYERYMVVIGSVGHLLFVFQTIKILQTGCARDLSLGGFVISFVSLVSWLIYGLMKKDKPLIIVNVFGSVAAFGCICAILIFR